MDGKTAARPARRGERMLEIKVRFWTNDLAPEGEILPKHGWTRGVVRITPNEAHGIESGRAVPFNSLLELTAKIEVSPTQQRPVLRAATSRSPGQSPRESRSSSTTRCAANLASTRACLHRTRLVRAPTGPSLVTAPNARLRSARRRIASALRSLRLITSVLLGTLVVAASADAAAGPAILPTGVTAITDGSGTLVVWDRAHHVALLVPDGTALDSNTSTVTPPDGCFPSAAAPDAASYSRVILTVRAPFRR